MLGFLHLDNPKIDGLTGNERQPLNVDDPSGKSVKVNNHGYDISPSDPCHSFLCQGEQIYGVKHIDTKKFTNQKWMDSFKMQRADIQILLIQ